MTRHNASWVDWYPLMLIITSKACKVYESSWPAKDRSTTSLQITSLGYKFWCSLYIKKEVPFEQIGRLSASYCSVTDGWHVVGGDPDAERWNNPLKRRSILDKPYSWWFENEIHLQFSNKKHWALTYFWQASQASQVSRVRKDVIYSLCQNHRCQMPNFDYLTSSPFSVAQSLQAIEGIIIISEINISLSFIQTLFRVLLHFIPSRQLSFSHISSRVTQSLFNQL